MNLINLIGLYLDNLAYFRVNSGKTRILRVVMELGEILVTSQEHNNVH